MSRELELDLEVEKLREQVKDMGVKPIDVLSPIVNLLDEHKMMWLRDSRVKKALTNLFNFTPKKFKKRKKDPLIVSAKLELKRAVEAHLSKFAGAGWKVDDITLIGRHVTDFSDTDAIHVEVSHIANIYNKSGQNVSRSNTPSKHIMMTEVFRYEL